MPYHKWTLLICQHQLCRRNQRNLQPCVALLENNLASKVYISIYQICSVQVEKWTENESGEKEYQWEDQASSIWQLQLSNSSWEMVASALENPCSAHILPDIHNFLPELTPTASQELWENGGCGMKQQGMCRRVVQMFSSERCPSLRNQ